MSCKLSIVIPTYNSEKTISETLLSVQTIWSQLESTEIIIVDGKSSDSTLLIASNSKLPLIIHSDPDRGIYDAMNKGAALANGNWVFFLGSDDILLPEFVDAVSSLQHPSKSYYAQVLLSRDNIVYCGKFNTLKLQLKNICHQSIFYSKSELRIKQFSESYRFLADYVFNLESWASNKNHFQYLPYLVCRYNNQTGSSSSAPDTSFARAKKSIILKEFGFFSFLLYGATATLLKVVLLIPSIRKHWKSV
jgi:glycosyltransferase involved in cell wall biosynthesis